MSNKFTKITLLTILGLALVLIFSCGGVGDDPSGGSGGNFGGGSCDISSYKSRKMPDGKIWMLENLNCKVAGSECYEKKESNCKKYGRLYSWDAANKACSGSWHLPTHDEWYALVTAVGGASTAGTKLKADNGWTDNVNGTDEFGFSALPGGYGSSGGRFSDVGEYGLWWSSTESGSNHAYYRYMSYNYNGVSWYDSGKSTLFSVRCLQD